MTEYWERGRVEAIILVSMFVLVPVVTFIFSRWRAWQLHRLHQRFLEERGPLEQATQSFMPKAPHEICTVTVKNLSYWLPVDRPNILNRLTSRQKGNMTEDDAQPGMRTILNGVSAYFRPGAITAIMGHSGSGKSTLLDLLTCRRHTGVYAGSIEINGIPLESIGDRFYEIAGYVHQSDVNWGRMSVREVLLYSAMMQLPNSFTLTDRFNRVEEVIRDLGLSKCADVQVHGAGEVGISGGQHRRLSVAIQMLAGPPLLFLDEPTSGLDASTSLDLMRTMRRLARTGITIILTIHQPRKEIFDEFDDLLVLSHGQVAFFGSTEEVAPYFSPYLSRVTSGGSNIHETFHYNPTDVLLDILSDANGLSDQVCLTHESTKRAEIERFIDGVASADPMDMLTEAASELLSRPKLADDDDDHATVNMSVPLLDPKAKRIRGRSLFVQVFVLNIRNWKAWLSSKGELFKQLIASLLVVGLVFMNQDNNFSSHISLLFISMSTLTLFKNAGIMYEFFSEKEIFHIEQYNRTTSALAFQLHRAIVDITFVSFETILFFVPLYYWTGLATDADRMPNSLIILIAFTNAFLSQINLIFSLASDLNLGAMVSSGLIGLSAIFTGFFLSIQNTTVAFRWIYWISGNYLGFSSLAFVQLYNLTCSVPAECPVPGTKILALDPFDLTPNNTAPYLNTIGLLIMSLACRLIAIVVLTIQYSTHPNLMKIRRRLRWGLRKESPVVGAVRSEPPAPSRPNIPPPPTSASAGSHPASETTSLVPSTTTPSMQVSSMKQRAIFDVIRSPNRNPAPSSSEQTPILRSAAGQYGSVNEYYSNSCTKRHRLRL